MMHLSLRTVSILVWVVGWNLAGYAQQGTPGPNMGEKVKVEGVVTAVQFKPGQGPPYLEVKAQDGKQYLVQLGPMQALQQQGFSPKVNDKITVSGFLCCDAGGKQMVHSTEIAWAGKTYQTPMDPAARPMGMGGPGRPAAGTAPGSCCWQQQQQ
ncbi:MAG: OB-fold nucleic acid binding domain-containing protein [Acidobacteria bacterium]|nr:OB-fold nucleic acid binding domain-containing protein [Acidobacteriota bacterium]